jgi:hypothetical protein
MSGLLAPACASPVEQDRASSEPPERVGAVQPERKVTSNSTSAGSPTSISQRYRTLDEYLAFLESRAPMDGHWYREIRPGVYRLETGNLRGVEPQQRVFTREELERQFGFSPS